MDSALPLADEETSSDDYRSRFSGSVGEWLLERQSTILSSLILPSHKSVLDVGGGHGQLVSPLANCGLNITIIGSSPLCSKQIESYVKKGVCKFEVGDLLSLPYPDKSFDVVTCFRFISHCDDWNKLICELCRVARTSVILDYPPLMSSNLLGPALFHIKKLLEGNTRPFTIFRHNEVSDAFKMNSFLPVVRRGEFLFPMVIHRVLKKPPISEALERFFRPVGLTDLFGSPTIARFDRI